MTNKDKDNWDNVWPSNDDFSEYGNYGENNGPLPPTEKLRENNGPLPEKETPKVKDDWDRDWETHYPNYLYLC